MPSDSAKKKAAAKRAMVAAKHGSGKAKTSTAVSSGGGHFSGGGGGGGGGSGEGGSGGGGGMLTTINASSWREETTITHTTVPRGVSSDSEEQGSTTMAGIMRTATVCEERQNGISGGISTTGQQDFPTRVTFPPCLTARQRAILHEAAEEAGFQHGSVGETESVRRLVVWREDAEGEHVIVPCASSEMDDQQLIDIAQGLLGLDIEYRTGSGIKETRVQGGKREVKMLNGTESKVENASTVRHRPAPKKAEPMSLEMFVSKMIPLIDLEKGAEMAFAAETTAQMKTETAQKKGRTLLNLKCVDATSGLLGKTLLVLEPSKGGIFPPHKFGSHDVVALKANRAEATAAALGEGVVYRVKDNAITVAMDDVPEEGLDAPLRVEKLANEVTYKRLKDTLTELHKGVRKGPATELVPVLFGDRYPAFAKKPIALTPFNLLLDESQQAAVAKALAAKDVMLLHGPPGTGKTTAVVEVITQEVKRGCKVLACAASNIAVDNLVERLVQNRVKVVRMGHPARLLPQVLESALDAQVLKADNTSIATDVRKEIKQLSSKLLKTKDRREKGELTRDLKRLAKEEKKRQTQAVVDVIKDADVIASTLTGALTHRLKDTTFDLVVIDEAAQALECACWIALLKGRRCVLAGDHMQLPPTVQSVEAEAKGLGVTLFERLDALYGVQVTSMLTVQYRMNSEIMRWSSDELYGGKIRAHQSVVKHRLCDMDGVTACNATEAVLVLIDTAGCDIEEMKEEEGDSTSNEGEAHVVMSHLQRLLEAGVRPEDIGVITPYGAQVGLLKEMRAKRKAISAVEMSTVDGFQGREKEAIVISMVRSNPDGEVGFLSDERRMNVAVTRARRHCAVVCDSDTVGQNAFLKRMVSYFEQHGEYLSAMEYLST